MKRKRFYRVANIETQQGLWYDFDGRFTGLIHTDFMLCKNSKLVMPYDPEIIGWLSATESLEDLYEWFTEDDIRRLGDHGYEVVEYLAIDYKMHNGHYVINKETSNVVRKTIFNRMSESEHAATRIHSYPYMIE